MSRRDLLVFLWFFSASGLAIVAIANGGWWAIVGYFAGFLQCWAQEEK